MRERLGGIAVVLDLVQPLLQRQPSVPAVGPGEGHAYLGFNPVDAVEHLPDEDPEFAVMVTGHQAARVSDASQRDASEAALGGTGEDQVAAW